MKTVQMTLDEELVTQVDGVVKRLQTTRSAFTRDALWSAIKQVRTQELEDKHRQGYRNKPVSPGEFSAWETEHKWGDE
ncbi:MAG TPA: CopG family transcriptional regulator [Kiritimatiellia bacterium]|nr:CopG family transcriptional regulator [Kiritimatiellia bacterium]